MKMVTMKGKRLKFFQIEFQKILRSSLWETWRICFMFLWKLWFHYGSMSMKFRIVERFCEEISWLKFNKSQKQFMKCMKSEFTFFHKLSVMVDQCGRWLKMAAPSRQTVSVKSLCLTWKSSLMALSKWESLWLILWRARQYSAQCTVYSIYESNL
jgi:hypothetical protein